MSDVAFRAVASGRVQGVGFRAGTRRQAVLLGLRGSATNLFEGRVEVRAEGARAACEALVDWLRGDAAPGAVTTVEVTWGEPAGVTGFVTR